MTELMVRPRHGSETADTRSRQRTWSFLAVAAAITLGLSALFALALLVNGLLAHLRA